MTNKDNTAAKTAPPAKFFSMSCDPPLNNTEPKTKYSSGEAEI